MEAQSAADKRQNMSFSTSCNDGNVWYECIRCVILLINSARGACAQAASAGFTSEKRRHTLLIKPIMGLDINYNYYFLIGGLLSCTFVITAKGASTFLTALYLYLKWSFPKLFYDYFFIVCEILITTVHYDFNSVSVKKCSPVECYLPHLWVSTSILLVLKM